MTDKGKTIVMNDDEIIKRKLLIDGDGIGDDRRIGLAMKQFIKWCLTEDTSSEESQLSLDRISLTLNQCELAMTKSDRMLNTCVQEMDNYEKLYNRVDNQIVEAQQKIEASKEELVNAKRIRKNKFEYDALAAIINEHADRRQSMERLKNLQEEIKELESTRDEMEKKLERRRKQFQVLLGAAHQLHQILNEEENESSEMNGVSNDMANEVEENMQMEVDS